MTNRLLETLPKRGLGTGRRFHCRTKTRIQFFICEGVCWLSLSSGRVIAYDQREDIVRPRVRREDEPGQQEEVKLASYQAANDSAALTASIIQALASGGNQNEPPLFDCFLRINSDRPSQQRRDGPYP